MLDCLNDATSLKGYWDHPKTSTYVYTVGVLRKPLESIAILTRVEHISLRRGVGYRMWGVVNASENRYNLQVKMAIETLCQKSHEVD